MKCKFGIRLADMTLKNTMFGLANIWHMYVVYMEVNQALRS